MNLINLQIKNPPLWLVNLTAFCVSLSLATVLIYSSFESTLEKKLEQQQEATRALPQPQTLVTNPFNEVNLVGKAAIVLDVTRKKVVFAHNEDAQLPLASLTKLMTALIAAETLPAYTAIEIRPRIEERDVQLKVGERWNLKDLLAYTLMTSSNTGADSMAAAAANYLEGEGTSGIGTDHPSLFVKAMNEKAAELGLKQTYFLNPSGLDTNQKLSGAYGSAQDVAILLSYIITKHPGLLDATEYPEQTFIAPDGRKIKAHNTNAEAITIPGIIASKTGLTDLAGGNLAIAFDASFNEPFVVAVLGSSEEERFKDVQKLVYATIQYLGTGLKTTSRQDLPAFSYNP